MICGDGYIEEELLNSVWSESEFWMWIRFAFEGCEWIWCERKDRLRRSRWRPQEFEQKSPRSFWWRRLCWLSFGWENHLLSSVFKSKGIICESNFMKILKHLTCNESCLMLHSKDVDLLNWWSQMHFSTCWISVWTHNMCWLVLIYCYVLLVSSDEWLLSKHSQCNIHLHEILPRWNLWY